MSKKLIISEEEKKYLMSLYSNKDIIQLLKKRNLLEYTNPDAPAPGLPDAGTWTLEKAITKWPCLNNLAEKPITILNNGSYDYIKIVWDGLPFNAFLGDGHLYKESSKSFTGKYLGSKDLPCIATPSPDAGNWTYDSALKKYPCLKNLAKDKTILNNGSYDYITINWNNKAYYAFLGDGRLFDINAKQFTVNYLGVNVPCQENSTDIKFDSQPSKPKPYTTKYIDQLANQLQLPGKSEQEKINQIMGELNKITPKKATA